MAGTLIRLDVRTRETWRRWLVKHHASTPGVWLLRHKQHTGVRSMPYEDLVREALCFGWVHGLVKRLDDNVYAIKVTPRQPASKWSDPNRKRWFYAPIVMVLGVAYLIGGALAFGVHFLGWFAMPTGQTPRLILALFGMGILGATSYSVRWWAKDMEEALRDPALLPHPLDAFGYAATIVGGGITGVMLYLVARGAATVAVDSFSPPMLRPSVAFVLAFCGGLFEFKVEALLQKYVTEVGKRAGNV